MLHLSTEKYNNERVVQRFLGRISSETCLKMDYFGSKPAKIAKRWGLCPQTPLPLAAEGFAHRPHSG